MEKWTFKTHTSALADTGDYEGFVQFTNGKDILQTSGDEIEEDQLQQFCDLLDCMPDLWSHKNDAIEFENSQLRKQAEHLKSVLEQISTAPQPYNEREAFSFVETAKEIASKALRSEDLINLPQNIEG